MVKQTEKSSFAESKFDVVPSAWSKIDNWHNAVAVADSSHTLASVSIYRSTTIDAFEKTRTPLSNPEQPRIIA